MRSAASILKKEVESFRILIDATRGYTVGEMNQLIDFLSQLTGEEYELRGHGPKQIQVTAKSAPKS